MEKQRINLKSTRSAPSFCDGFIGGVTVMAGPDCPFFLCAWSYWGVGLCWSGEDVWWEEKCIKTHILLLCIFKKRTYIKLACQPTKSAIESYTPRLKATPFEGMRFLAPKWKSRNYKKYSEFCEQWRAFEGIQDSVSWLFGHWKWRWSFGLTFSLVLFTRSSITFWVLLHTRKYHLRDFSCSSALRRALTADLLTFEASDGQSSFLSI